MIQSRLHRFIRLSFLGIVAAAIAAGQTAGTEILGRVIDSSGAAVAGAKVTEMHVATGQAQTQLTNQDGEFTFPLVEIGEHTVRVEKDGFVSRTVTGLRVETQQKARVD